MLAHISENDKYTTTTITINKLWLKSSGMIQSLFESIDVVHRDYKRATSINE